MGMAGNHLRPEVGELRITQAKNGIERFTQRIGALKQLCFLSGKSECTTDQHLHALLCNGLHADQILSEEGVCIVLQIGAKSCEPMFIGRAVGQEIEIRR